MPIRPRSAASRSIIAGAGGAAHLPGMTASMTALPVLGVPIESQALKGMDSLLSIVQMPAGVPVGTLAIGKAGAINAALLAAAMLATSDEALGRAARRLAREADRIGGRSARMIDSAGLDHRHHRRRPARPDAGDRRGPARLPLPHLRPARAAAARRDVAAGITRAAFDDARRAATLRRSGRCRDLRVRESARSSRSQSLGDKLRPGTRSLAIAQDRAREKEFIERCGARVAPWRAVDSLDDVEAAVAELGAAARAQDPPLRL